MTLKDDRLAGMAHDYNVARFASFGPDLSLRHLVLDKGGDQYSEASLENIIRSLFQIANNLNVRTFLNDQSKSTDFVYGLTSIYDVIETVRRFGNAGLHTIVNETIDVSDGGISGVALSGVVEFAPDDTPRVVEKPGNVVARLPTQIASYIFACVYGVDVSFPYENERLEFSLHPSRVGCRQENLLFWEVNPTPTMSLSVQPTWPNNFSRLIGDKVFGLLIASAYGFPVPYTSVTNRRIAPFSFGQRTGTSEKWFRTSPSVAAPGRYTTTKGWIDPFALMAAEDPDGKFIPSVLSQDSVQAAYSGGALTQAEGKPVIEGRSGHGDGFMLGATRERLPEPIVEDVANLISLVEDKIGPSQIEWVHDGQHVWIVQLHSRVSPVLTSGTLSPGSARRWISFDPELGLDKLRQLTVGAFEEQAGIEVTGLVGVTSHVGDILRQAGVPGRLSLQH